MLGTQIVRISAQYPLFYA
jgi:cell division cycle 14